MLVDYMLENWPEGKDAFPAEVRAAYVRQFGDQARAHAICEEFRAAATLDYDQDQADRESRKIACPLLFLWSQHGRVATLYDDPLLDRLGFGEMGVSALPGHHTIADLVLIKARPARVRACGTTGGWRRRSRCRRSRCDRR
ncbi:hypothetical protein [Micromonospora sp. NPDC005172]|uniref:hypothetical protein n=1 Tax=Micromonospora sp. NPDC005172 TaxID=3156867 RepID=UPI0033AF59EF